MIVSNVSTSCVLGYLSPSFFYARSSIPLATLRRCNVTSIRLLCQLKIFLSAILRENQREENFSSLARPWDRSTNGSSSSLCFYGITIGDEEIMLSTFSCCTTIGWNSRTFVLVNSSLGFAGPSYERVSGLEKYLRTVFGRWTGATSRRIMV